MHVGSQIPLLSDSHRTFLSHSLAGVKINGNPKRALSLEKFQQFNKERPNRELFDDKIFLHKLLINFASKCLIVAVLSVEL